MKIPFKYTLKNFSSRKLTTAITLVGISLVVFVFAAVLMMAYGIQKTLVATGSQDNVMVIRKAANGEISSLIEGDAQNVIRTLPHIKTSADGKQIISNEPVVIINLARKNGGVSNVTVRGVAPVALQLRPQIKIIEGRMINFGLKELIAGRSINERFNGANIGDVVNFAGDKWTVVGIFDTDGSGFDSEMWGDATQLLSSFNRGNTVSSVTFKLDNANNFENFKRAFEVDRRLQQYEPKIEQKFFEEQSELMATFIRILGIFITIIFSFGAIIGAMITMYSAVANRTVEIGTLRALGFKRRSILSAFMAESMLISLIGWAIGILLASVLSFFKISTLNFGSFSELEFSFALSPSIVISSLLFSVIMGILGGFLPSVRAARLNIVKALRAG
ncbi:MAG: ABC transporter permease [Ignavibacterium sp.]|jgi:ABC-type antimicrobial peptide transport system permease subunit|nr:ABC transporter permease [Ignavibacterium sp.]